MRAMNEKMRQLHQLADLIDGFNDPRKSRAALVKLCSFLDVPHETEQTRVMYLALQKLDQLTEVKSKLTQERINGRQAET